MTAIANRLALVTGAASGIGFAIARALQDAGARVIITDVDEQALTASSNILGCPSYRLNVSVESEVNELAATVARDHGHVSLLVNNAGVASTAALTDMQKADWDWLLGVNFYGLVYGVRAFLPHMREVGSGHILNTGSTAGFRPDPGQGGYGVTKFAMTAYTEVLAQELPSEIGVTLLVPGPVRTRLGTSSRNRPDTLPGVLTDVDLVDDPGYDLRWIDPDDVAAQAIRGVEANTPYVVTHGEWTDAVVDRHRKVERAFRDAPAAESSSHTE